MPPEIEDTARTPRPREIVTPRFWVYGLVVVVITLFLPIVPVVSESGLRYAFVYEAYEHLFTGDFARWAIGAVVAQVALSFLLVYVLRLLMLRLSRSLTRE